MIALPLFLQMSLEYNAMQAGLSLAPLSLSMFAVALLASKKETIKRRPSEIVLAGFALSTLGLVLILPIVPRADSGWALLVPLLIAGSGLGMLVSQLNNYTLSPIEEERVSEAAGVNSAAGSFGLSFGLAMAGGILLATLAFSFTHLTESSDVIPAAQQQQIADALEEDAEVMSTSQLEEQITGQPEDVEREILRINSEANEPRAAGRAPRADRGQPPRLPQRLPHAPAAGPGRRVVDRGPGVRLIGAGAQAVIARTRAAISRPRSTSGPVSDGFGSCRARSFDASPARRILPPKKACISAWGSSPRKSALAVS